MNNNFYLIAAQVIPVLYLAIVFQQRAISGTGPNIYDVFGVPAKMSVLPKWLRFTLGPFIILVPLHFFAGEVFALWSVAVGHPLKAANYFVTGTLLIGGIVLILPLIVRGSILTLNAQEFNFGMVIGRILFAILGSLIMIYTALGIVLFISN